MLRGMMLRGMMLRVLVCEARVVEVYCLLRRGRISAEGCCVACSWAAPDLRQAVFGKRLFNSLLAIKDGVDSDDV